MEAKPDTTELAMQRLEEVAQHLRDQIDGGEECRSRDVEITSLIEYVDGARRLLAVYLRFERLLAERVA